VSIRVVAALWLVLGAAVWNGLFDLYVSRGAREYGQLRVEHELGRGPDPDMRDVMSRAVRDGAWGSSAWASLVVGAGWATIWVSRRRPRQAAGDTPALR
jgi:hypothetical protein